MRLLAFRRFLLTRFDKPCFQLAEGYWTGQIQPLGAIPHRCTDHTREQGALRCWVKGEIYRLLLLSSWSRSLLLRLSCTSHPA